MLSERGVWIAYDKILNELSEVQRRSAARSYLVDLRDMALAAARNGINVKPCNSDTDRPQKVDIT